MLLRELQERGHTGRNTPVTGSFGPNRGAVRAVAVRRFGAPAGKQARVDRGYLGSAEWECQSQKG